jgi:uncharacterized protein (TIGR01655 family)
MKKLLIGLVVLVVVVFGGLKLYSVLNYGGTTYYTKVTTPGKKITQHDQQGNAYVDYQYQLAGYDDEGHKQILTFNANKTRPLKQNAYLKLTYNDKKGVTRWTAIKKSAVPQQALAQLP